MTRTEARAAAMKLVYEWQMGGDGGDDTFEGLLDHKRGEDESGFATDLYNYVLDNSASIDSMISGHLKGWSMDRIPPVELAILRVAVAELLMGSTPGGVIINEAVRMSSRYSTDRSSSYINGVLAAIRREETSDGDTGD